METTGTLVRPLAIAFLIGTCLLTQAIESDAYPIPELERFCSHRADIVLGTVLYRSMAAVADSCQPAFVEYKVAIDEVFKGGITPGSAIVVKEMERWDPFHDTPPTDWFDGYVGVQYVLFLRKVQGSWEAEHVRELRLGKREMYYHDLRAALGLEPPREKRPFISEETAEELAKAYAIRGVINAYGNARVVRWAVKDSKLSGERWTLSVSYWIEVMSADETGRTRTDDVGFDSTLIILDAETGEVISQLCP